MKKKFNSVFNYNRANLFKDIPDELWFDYKWQLSNKIDSLEKLSAFLPEIDTVSLAAVVEKFGFSITPYFLCLIDMDNIYEDPLFKQVIPDVRELIFDPLLNIDPFKEDNMGRNPVPGFVMRYPDRGIIVTTSFCPSMCRYCTRKWNWCKQYSLTRSDLNGIIEYLKKHPEIREIIISGGEPLLLENDFIDTILSEVSSVESVESMRIGTRILSFLPYRVTDELVEILKKYFPVWIITHFNHENEISEFTEKAVRKIVSSGSSLCNQSVLLKGVNDNIATMKNLVHALQRIMVKPYYLFYPDLVEGTSHFRGTLENGLDVMMGLRGHTGGLCIPQFVVDLPDGGKIPLLPEYIVEETDDSIVFKNYENKIFKYDKIGKFS